MIKRNNYYVTSRFSRQTYSGRDVYMYINSYQVSNVIDLPQYCTKKKVLKYVQLKSTLVIIILYYYAYTDLLVEILVDLLYNLI